MYMYTSCSVVSDSLQPHGLQSPASLSMEFSNKNNWSGLPFLSPRDLPNSGTKARSPALQAWEAPTHTHTHNFLEDFFSLVVITKNSAPCTIQ